MPKQGSRAEVNTFVKGLVTEASPLNFPANASLDEVNFELLRDGTRKRRLGIDKESGSQEYVATTLSLFNSNPAITKFVWESVGGDSTKDYLAVQSGSYLRIFDLANLVTGSVPLFEFSSSLDNSSPWSFASVNGSLVIAGSNSADSILLVSYNQGTFNSQYIRIKVRDIWGVEDTEAVEKNPDARQSAISRAGLYNYYNQSWGLPRRNKAGTLVSPLSNYKTSLSKYPSNNEVVWTGLAYVPQTGTTDPYEAMYPNLYEDRFGADLSATKGYFIIDLIERGTSRREAFDSNNVKFPEMAATVPDSESPGIPLDKSFTGPGVICEFAGRIFYAGFGGSYLAGDARSPTLNNYVFFSQLVKNDADITKCYQVGDPTSRDNSEVVETDGGFVRIAGARKIVAFQQLGSNLVILADNGVWTLSGGSDFGFSATNYKVDKVSDFGCVSPTSIVTDGNSLLFWGSDAIYAASGNNTGMLVVDDITRDTIQTRYNSFPLAGKRNCRGVYDLFNKKLRWVFNTGTLFQASNNVQELVFDLSLKCFYLNSIANTPDYKRTLTTPVFYSSRSKPLFYIYTFVPVDLPNTISYSFAEYKDTGFRDWRSFDGVGVDAKAYMLTGAMLAGDSAVDKQTPYILTHMKPTETGADSEGVAINQSSCLMRAQWDWSNNINSNKFGSTQEVYGYRHPNFTNTNDGYDVTTTKRKLRGKGKAISLHFETQPDKDCQLLGWSLTINGNAIA